MHQHCIILYEISAVSDPSDKANVLMNFQSVVRRTAATLPRKSIAVIQRTVIGAVRRTAATLPRKNIAAVRDRRTAATSPRQRIAVIGAGPNGLSALKTFRDHGYPVVLFEQESSIGGLWSYRDDGKLYASLPDRDRRINSCYSSLTMNTSKRISQYSDFPAKDTVSAFMNHSQFLGYLQDYARHFRLGENIKFDCTVAKLCPTKLRPAREASAGQWEVHYAKGGASEMEIFDKVVVATGPFPVAVLPEYPGMDEFRGTMVHSAQVRQDKKLFEYKRVLVVGGSYSAAEMIDIALKSNVKGLYWSFGDSSRVKNSWVFDRFPTVSGTWDEIFTRQNYFKNHQEFLQKFSSWLQPIRQSEDKPQLKFPPDRMIITNTKKIFKGLLSGRIRLVAPVSNFSQHLAFLSDGSTLDEIDVVVFCTGFSKRFHFLDGLWDLNSQREAVLYRHMLPTERHLQGLGFVGMAASPLASLFPTAEMQSRWLAKFWASRSYDSKGSLYSEKEIDFFRAAIDERMSSLVPSQSYNMLSDSHGYVEALASEVGCQPPNSDSLLSADRELALALLHGPITAAQYRIVGPHSWTRARECVIKTAREVLGEKWQELLASK